MIHAKTLWVMASRPVSRIESQPPKVDSFESLPDDSTHMHVIMSKIEELLARLTFTQQDVKRTAKEMEKIGHSVKYGDLADKVNKLTEVVSTTLLSYLQEIFHQSHTGAYDASKIKEIVEQMLLRVIALEDSFKHIPQKTEEFSLQVSSLTQEITNLRNNICAVGAHTEQIHNIIQNDQTQRNAMYSDVLALKSLSIDSGAALTTCVEKITMMEKKIEEQNAIISKLNENNQKIEELERKIEEAVRLLIGVTNSLKEKEHNLEEQLKVIIIKLDKTIEAPHSTQGNQSSQ